MTSNCIVHKVIRNVRKRTFWHPRSLIRVFFVRMKKHSILYNQKFAHGKFFLKTAQIGLNPKQQISAYFKSKQVFLNPSCSEMTEILMTGRQHT